MKQDSNGRFMKDGYTVVLNADHIKPFAYFPELRLELSNGRTLCVECHRKTPTFARGARKIYEFNKVCV